MRENIKGDSTMNKTLFCKNCQMYVSEILLQHEEKFLIKGDLSLTGYNPILKGWICPNCGERHYFKQIKEILNG